jgi:peptidoglycan/xylan/chitin deacetylase (PgdA/CDA1 family)
MSILREILVRGLRSEALNRMVHLTHANTLTVLCYHGVVEQRLGPEHHRFLTTVSASDFTEQIEWLPRWFTPVSAAAVRDWHLGRGTLPRHPLLITFDDGYRNNFTLAAPILRKCGVPAVFFVSTGYMEADRLYWYDELRLRLLAWRGRDILVPGRSESQSWPAEPRAQRALAQRISTACKTIPNDERLEYTDYVRRETPEWRLENAERETIRPMNWDEVRSLSNQGFEIGSHTVDHPILSRLDPAALRRELRDSKSRIEEITGKPCFAIAYPNGKPGDISPAVVAETEAAGYELGFIVDERLHRPGGNRFLISRISAAGHAPPGVMRMRVSGLHSLLNFYRRK